MAETSLPSPRKRGSISRRLPLVIFALLAVTIAAFAWAANHEVEQALLDSTRVRLQSVARQLGTFLRPALTQRLEESARLAVRPEFRVLISGSEDRRAAAVESVTTFLRTSPQTLSFEVWNGAGERVIAVPNPSREDAVAAIAAGPDTQPKDTGITPLANVGPVIFYAVVTRVTSAEAAGAPPGTLRIRRAINTTGAGAAEAIQRLIGGGLSLKLGSPQSGLWTDMAKVVTAPPAVPRTQDVIAFQTASGEARLGIGAPIGRTPLMAWVEVPRDVALGPARQSLRRLLPIAIATVVGGTLLGVILARRMTRPLTLLTRASEALAAGDYSTRAATRGNDEIGRLGDVFNNMAAHIEDGYARLDVRVNERTRELKEALETLQETQQQLVRREKLATLGQMASGVGHELRNPLGVMTNAVYYLDMVQPDASPDVREYHGILRMQIGLAEKIVSDLLDFARVRAPQRERATVGQLVDDQRARLGAPDDIEIVTDLPGDLPAVFVDQVQIGQVVLNLLINAVQAMESSGGTLTLRARVDGPMVRLDVIDTGPGVPPELREQIFEALFTTKARGIGLGLSVSRALARNNGGDLTLATSTGAGATFTLTLPTGPEPRS